MKRLLMAVVTALPLAALAHPSAAAPGAAPDPAAAERWHEQARAFRTQHLAQALGLNEADTQKLTQTLQSFDAQRKPLQQQVREARQTLKAAAEGKAQAASQVDVAVQNLFQAREKLFAVNREMFTSLSRGLTPEQRAKLALVLQKGGRHMEHGAGRWHDGDR